MGIDRARLLAAYDEQLRGPSAADRLPSSVDGPLVRVEYPRRGAIRYRSLAGIEGAELDALIIRQREFFAGKGKAVEWAVRSHDLPADLSTRLQGAGFVPEDSETIVIAESSAIVAALGRPALPQGVVIRHTDQPADFERIARLESEVWDEDWSWLAAELADQVAAEPGLVDVYVAEADAHVVSAAWSVHVPGTDFTGLWGGSTLAAWRRKGLYKALVAVRAARAVERGCRYLNVDASDDSRPILQRLGFVAVTTSTPYVFTP